MARVQRPPIQADIGEETVRLDEPLRGVVAALAEALERTKPEFVDVAVMRLNVIADCRRRDDAALCTILTQRMLEQLVLPDPSPASRGVPLVPLRRLAANAHGSTYHPPAEAPSTGRRAVREGALAMTLPVENVSLPAPAHPEEKTIAVAEIGESRVTERVTECRSAKRTRTVTVRPGRDFARSLLATLSAR